MNLESNIINQAEAVRVTVGVKHGHVIINSHGNRAVEPHFTALTPKEARQLAKHLLRCAKFAEGA